MMQVHPMYTISINIPARQQSVKGKFSLLCSAVAEGIDLPII